MAGLVTQFMNVWGGLTPARRVALIAVPLFALSIFIALIFWVGRPTYGVLFSNLGQEDAAAIVENLKERKVSYRLAGGGGMIQVPEEEIYDLRLALAMEGLPRGGGVGFELFDRSSFGATEFVQRVNLQRALQGELARTVRQFPQVSGARVHLSLPERSLFVREGEEPRATVVLNLRPGTSLKSAQLQGIVFLVASSVQGMRLENVSVVDTTGRVLFSPADEGGPDGVNVTSLVKLKSEIENRLEGKIEAMLTPLVGAGNMVARVSVDLDPRRVEQAEESYDPDSAAVRSEQRSKEKSTGAGGLAAGVPGVMSNSPGKGGEEAASGATRSSSQRQKETINYELNRTTRKIVSPMGEVRRLTAAVLVDGVEKNAEGAGAEEPSQVVPRGPEEIRQFEEIVKRAVGFDAQRGDTIRVASAPFVRAKEEARVAEAGWKSQVEYWLRSPALRYGAAVILALVLLFAVVRPLIRGVLSALRESAPAGGGRGPAGELEGGSGPMHLMGPAASQELVKMAEEDPHLFAAALKNWIRQEK